MHGIDQGSSRLLRIEVCLNASVMPGVPFDEGSSLGFVRLVGSRFPALFVRDDVTSLTNQDDGRKEEQQMTRSPSAERQHYFWRAFGVISL